VALQRSVAPICEDQLREAVQNLLCFLVYLLLTAVLKHFEDHQFALSYSFEAVKFSSLTFKSYENGHRLPSCRVEACFHRVVHSSTAIFAEALL
jgi:hypothetical protein